MAGYLMVLGDVQDDNGNVIATAESILLQCFENGTYSTRLMLHQDTKNGTWARTKESTFTDYLGMKAGDYVFFFFDRKIYGIGKLVNVEKDCKYWAYNDAWKPTVRDLASIEATRLYDGIVPENRCVCFFEPCDKLYGFAVDMDEALSAYPDTFKALRVIENRSFIKMDDEEAAALAAVIIKKNASIKEGDTPDIDCAMPFNSGVHTVVRNKVVGTDQYDFTAASILQNYPIRGVDGIASEQMVEAAVIEQLTKNPDSVLGRWSYVCHQVQASPAKPVQYMEWMDVFGYRKSPAITVEDIPIPYSIDKYLVIEIKRDKLTLHQKNQHETNIIRETRAVINQTMKYVDWVTKNYVHGSYPMVKAIIVANGFDQEFIDYCKTTCVRNYNRGYRNSMPDVWADVELIEYSFNGKDIMFKSAPK